MGNLAWRYPLPARLATVEAYPVGAWAIAMDCCELEAGSRKKCMCGGTLGFVMVRSGSALNVSHSKGTRFRETNILRSVVARVVLAVFRPWVSF